jgi:hypothetical protein
MEAGAEAKAKAEAYALSDTDIQRLLGGSIKITTYSDLEKMHSIDEAFDGKGRAILFFPQNNEQSGHWCCMIKKGREIEFFDPYGEEPDDQKSGIPKHKLEQMNMDKPVLSDLLENSGYRIIFNKVQLQKLNNDTQTCGRHCVTRLLYASYPIKRYRDIIARSGLTADEFVVDKTIDNLGK